jgi:peptidoglycan/xylan/chitin deacetylase (PgdA/CDA1 family)
MKFYFVKTPWLFKFIFRNWVWSFSENQKIIYLTFDDGPTPEITPWILNLLQKFNAQATFFCIGKNMVKHPEIFQAILKNNHSFGNHTNDHLNGWKTNTDLYIENCLEAANTTEHPTKLFRPPYGKLFYSQSKRLRNKGFKIIMWDVLSADFDTKISKEKCLQNVLKNTRNGSILVFHDSSKASKKLKFVLPKVLEYFTEKGYSFQKIV